MQVNVSTLLRDFPRVRRAALNGERVLIRTRDGDLVLEADRSAPSRIFGSMKGEILRTSDDLDRPTTADADWRASL